MTLVNEDGTIVGRDPDTDETVPVDLESVQGGVTTESRRSGGYSINRYAVYAAPVSTDSKAPSRIRSATDSASISGTALGCLRFR